LFVTLNGSQALWLAFDFCQKQKQLKAPTKGTLNKRKHEYHQQFVKGSADVKGTGVPLVND
jgi:hypothetical protein